MPPLFSISLGDPRPWRAEPDPGISWNVCYEDQALCIKLLPKPGLLAIEAVHTDPAKRNTILAGIQYHIKSDLGLGPESNILGNFANVAKLIAFCPILWKVELSIDQYSLVSSDITENNSHLTILNFSQSTAILPLYTYGAISLLGKSCFINMQRSLNRISNQFADLFLKFVDQDPFIPWRMRYEMLQRLIGALADLICESAAIASTSIQQQALQIFPGISAAISCTCHEGVSEIHVYQFKY